jgi:hypothetical protein
MKVVKAHGGSTPIRTTEVTAGKTTQFPGAVVTVGRRGPGGGDGREDDAFPKHGGDGQATWTRWRWWCRGQEGGDGVPTTEEERDGVVPGCGGEGQANDAVLGHGDGMEAVGVAAAVWTQRRRRQGDWGFIGGPQ